MTLHTLPTGYEPSGYDEHAEMISQARGQVLAELAADLRGLSDLTHPSRHPRPVVVAHPAGPHLGQLDSRLGRQQPHHDLRLAHLQAEDHAGHSVLDRAGTHNVQCQSRFALRCNRFRG